MAYPTTVSYTHLTSSGLKDVDGPRGQKGQGGKGDAGLNHHQHLGPAGEHGRIGGRECGAGIECQEKIVHKAGSPAWVKRFLRSWSEGHLGKEEISFGMVAAKIARMRSARVQPPIPRRENQDVGGPERSRRPQQTRWRQLVPVSYTHLDVYKRQTNAGPS